MKDQLLLLLGLALLGPFLTIATKSILLHFWTIMFIAECYGRGRTVRRIALITVFLCAFIGLWIFGLKSVSAVTFLALAITPWMTSSFTALLSWRNDSSEDRIAALVIATERATRYHEAPPSLTQRWPWPDYLFDVEFARRRMAYEPPAI